MRLFSVGFYDKTLVFEKMMKCLFIESTLSKRLIVLLFFSNTVNTSNREKKKDKELINIIRRKEKKEIDQCRSWLNTIV